MQRAEFERKKSCKHLEKEKNYRKNIYRKKFLHSISSEPKKILQGKFLLPPLGYVRNQFNSISLE